MITIRIEKGETETYSFSLTDTQEHCLLWGLLSIEDWVEKAVMGKVNNCRKRFRAEWVSKLMDDPSVSSIPANDDQLVASVIQRNDYNDRRANELLLKDSQYS